MSEDRKSAEYRVTVSGGVPGQLAVGESIAQTSVSNVGAPLTDEEYAELKNMLHGLRAQVADEAAADARDSAIERVDELEEAITGERPDLTTMEYVKSWFAKHLPKLAGAVAAVLVNPLVQAGRIGRRRAYRQAPDRKSTRLNSSHVRISYAVFCLKKKKKTIHTNWEQCKINKTQVE